jgi:type II secretory pathway pseudopilin PulG
MKALSRIKNKGFALIATLVLMILLVVMAVGLLSLSSISLRSSSQGDAQARARANARLALMMALGELQTYAGPDTRITATGSITGTPDKSKENITGVWESWKIDPKNPPGSNEYLQTGGKQQKFKKWLVSTPDPEEAEHLDFAGSQPPDEKARVTLVPEINRGTTTASAIYGGLVPVKVKTKQTGSYAFAVMDEGVKARLDTGYKPVTDTKLGDLATTLGLGARPDVAHIPGLEKIDWEAADASKSGYQLDKALSFSSVSLLLENLGASSDKSYQALQYDVTTSSLGVFSDAADGGLKQDMNSILNNGSALPADFSGTTNSKMYSTHLGVPIPSSTTTGQVEPSWQLMFLVASLQRTPAIHTHAGGPTLAMQQPAAWTSTSQPPPASTYQTLSMMPSVVKVQMYYSIIAVPLALNGSLTTKPTVPAQWTDSEAGLVAWASTAWDKGARYFMMMCMSPVVTLHNPYNTNLKVNGAGLSVELTNVPISIQLERKMASGGSSGWLPAKGQGADNIDTESKERPKTDGRKYVFDLTNGEKVYNFTMAPGEVRMFSPTVPSSASYASNPYRSWNNFTEPASAQPMALNKGFRGVTIGFYAPRITANEMQGYETYPTPGESKRNSLEYLGPNDQIRARIRPCLDSRISSATVEKGKCKVSLVQRGSNGGVVWSVTSLNVGTTGTSGNLLTGLETSLGLPATGQEGPWIQGKEIAISSGNAPLNGLKAYTFGAATISAKTTFGRFEDKTYDGVMAAKPMAFHSPAASYTVVDIAKNGLEPSPYEAGVIPLDSSAGTGFEEYLEVNASGRSYAISGLRASKGQQYGTIYEVPLAPLQNFSQLNSANPAGTNSLARFTYPIGNSWAHPMIAPSAVTGKENACDHSFLLNSLLYDKYYFSGIADRQDSSFLTAATTADLAKNFLENSSTGPSLDKRLIPYLPDGESEEGGITALSKASENDVEKPQARFRAASHQMMKGAFNVNSTSKQAWKAELASLHAPDAKMFLVNQSTPLGAVSALKAVEPKHTRFSRFTVPNSDAPADAADEQSIFQGPRDIDDDQLDSLVEEIVKQVRARGPFLSMAEFVNRQLGSSELAQEGALQAAIDATTINGNNSVLENTGYQLTSVSSK